MLNIIVLLPKNARTTLKALLQFIAFFLDVVLCCISQNHGHFFFLYCAALSQHKRQWNGDYFVTFVIRWSGSGFSTYLDAFSWQGVVQNRRKGFFWVTKEGCIFLNVIDIHNTIHNMIEHFLLKNFENRRRRKVSGATQHGTFDIAWILWVMQRYWLSVLNAYTTGHPCPNHGSCLGTRAK